MIVEPDFLTHWKTRALVRTLEYEAAPMCVLSFWAHCQQRKSDRFAMTAETFAAVCAYPFTGDADKFRAAMESSGFIEIDDAGMIVAHDFEKANSQLFANWNNGKMGGRPKTHRKPIHNPSETQNENGVTDRLDKIREEKKDKSTPALRYPANAGEEFKKLFERWVEFRKGLGKKPKNWTTLFQEQLDWLEHQPASARREIVSQSIRNGWQGLFEIKRQNGARPENIKTPKIDKIELPERFKSWVAEHYPDRREVAMKWRTWADVPNNGLRNEWWLEEKKKLPGVGSLI